MDCIDTFWITVCYDVFFEERENSEWILKHKGIGQPSLTPLLISKNISYAELYDKIGKSLGVDTRFKKMEFATLVPGISYVSIPPMKIDCDNNVLGYISVCKESSLCVSILTKDALENDENLRCEDALIVSPNDVMQNGDTCREPDLVHNQEIDSFEQRETYYANLDNPIIAAEILKTWNVRELIVGQYVDDVPDESCNTTSVQHLTVDLIPPQVGSSSRIPESEDVCAKQYFKCKKSLKSKLELLAMRCHFEFKVKKSNKSLYSIICIDENCKWRLRATKMKESHMFEIRKYFVLHTCSLSVRRKDHRHATYSIIGSHITSKYEDPSQVYTPKDIIHDIRTEFKIKISYTKAYMAKEYAMSQLRGSPDESYIMLPSCCDVLKQRNHGTLTAIESSLDKRFKYFFMALGQSIRGFQASIRRVISVDGTFLTNRYRGMLLIATCQDTNVQIYHLAWAVVDSENEESWTWFFHKLKEITGDTEEQVISSDRGKSIPNAFQRVYDLAHHVHCIWHLQNNMKKKFPKIDFAQLFKLTAEAFNVADFDNKMTALCSMHKGIRHYLEHDDGGLHIWSRAHCKRIRYNIMTTNNAESLNAALKNARDFPISGLIEHIRDMLQRWYYERHDEAEK